MWPHTSQTTANTPNNKHKWLQLLKTLQKEGYLWCDEICSSSQSCFWSCHIVPSSMGQMRATCHCFTWLFFKSWWTGSLPLTPEHIETSKESSGTLYHVICHVPHNYVRQYKTWEFLLSVPKCACFWVVETSIQFGSQRVY